MLLFMDLFFLLDRAYALVSRGKRIRRSRRIRVELGISIIHGRSQPFFVLNENKTFEREPRSHCLDVNFAA